MVQKRKATKPLQSSTANYFGIHPLQALDHLNRHEIADAPSSSLRRKRDRQKEPVTEGRFRYVPVPPRLRPRSSDAAALVRPALTAPLFGSRLLFPTQFDDVVAKSLTDPGAAELSPRHAFWYFGSVLRLWVDPALLKARLSDYVRDERGIRWIGSSFLDAANWSGAVIPLTRSPVHIEIVELVDANLDFARTRSYRKMLAWARRGLPVVRNGIVLSSVEAIEAYFRYCADLISSVRGNGVVPRAEMYRLDQRALLGHRKARPQRLNAVERDIGVAINGNGRLVRHLGGKHRTAIAQALQLPRIPVEVRLVHVRWLAREMRRTHLPAHLALTTALASLAGGADNA
jgi:hypothetical protein